MAGRRKTQSSGIGSNILLALLLTTFIFTLAVVLILNFKWLYYIDIALLGIEQRSGMSVASIKEHYDVLIRYNQFWNTGALQFPALPMSVTGRIHFQEVKVIFSVIQILCMVTFIGSIIGIIKKVRNRQIGYFKIAGLLSLAIPTILGISALLWWDEFFIIFHKIFFRNNYWLFDSKTDPVILMLPDAYFMHCAVGILLLIFLGSLLCLKIDKRQRRSLNRRKK